MSAIEMSSGVKFPYQRLRQESHDLDDIDEYQLREYYKKALARSRTWYRFRKVPIRRRFRLKIPGLRRLFRRKAKLVSSIRVSFASVVKRLKESQSHLGDLFAGNYLFLQVTPASFKCLDHKGHRHLNGLSSSRRVKINCQVAEQLLANFASQNHKKVQSLRWDDGVKS